MASRYHFPQQRPTLGAEIGSALGTGLGRGLTALAETKLDSMLARQKQGQLTAEFTKMGIPEQQAAYLAKQDPETQWQAVRQWWMSQGYEGSDIPESVHQEWSGQSPLQALGNAEQPTEAGPQQGALSAIQNQGQQQQAAQGSAMQALGAQAPQSQTVQQPQPASQPQRQPAKDLGAAFRMADEQKVKGKGTAGKKAALSPDAKLFIESTEKRAQVAPRILKDVNELEDFITEHEKEFQTNIFAANSPDALLNEPTRKLRQKMAKILNEMIQSEAQGRGSDLMRKIIAEGKLSLAQGPNVWREVLDELRDDQQDALGLSELKDQIRNIYGSTPDNIAGLARDTLAQEKTQFNSLPDTEKINYLFGNPDKMKWITELTDEGGEVIARRTSSGWKWVKK